MRRLLFLTTVLAALMLAWPVAAARRAPTFVQDDFNDSGTTPNVITMGSNTTAGNLMLVACYSTLTTNPTIVDSDTNSYALLDSHTDAFNAGMFIWAAPNINGGALDITVTHALATLVCWAGEYSGMATSSPLDQTAEADGTGTTATVTTGTTTQADEVVFGFIAGNANNFTPGTSPTFTGRYDDIPLVALLTEDRIVSSTGTQQCHATTGASDDWSVMCVTLKGAGGGAPASPLPALVRPRGGGGLAALWLWLVEAF